MAGCDAGRIWAGLSVFESAQAGCERAGVPAAVRMLRQDEPPTLGPDIRVHPYSVLANVRQ